MLTVECSSCHSKIRVPENAIGKKGKCPKCGTVITIAAPEEPPPAASGSPFDFDGGGAAPPPAPAPKKKSRAADTDDAFGSLGEGAAPPPADEDVEEVAAPSRPRAPDSPGLSIASLVCGILGVCCCPILPSIAAIVLGFMGKNKGGKGMAIAGIILGFVGLFLSCVGLIVQLLTGGFQFNAGGPQPKMRF
jgi:predicted Zn finger-like uncharacterized protein